MCIRDRREFEDANFDDYASYAGAISAAALRLVLLNIIERGVVDLPSILERGLLKDRRSRSSASSGIKPFGRPRARFERLVTIAYEISCIVAAIIVLSSM